MIDEEAWDKEDAFRLLYWGGHCVCTLMHTFEATVSEVHEHVVGITWGATPQVKASAMSFPAMQFAHPSPVWAPIKRLRNSGPSDERMPWNVFAGVLPL